MCAMMQKLRVNSMAMKAPLSGCGCSRSIGMPLGLSDLTHSVKISSMPKLTISDVTHELVDLAITIGRGPDNTIVVNDQSISTHHAQLLLEGDTYRLKDLNSTNGTRVNSKLVTEAVLRFDDRIRFGEAEALYESSEATRLKPLPKPEEIKAQFAEAGAEAPNLSSVSPLRRQEQRNDP